MASTVTVRRPSMRVIARPLAALGHLGHHRERHPAAVGEHQGLVGQVVEAVAVGLGLAHQYLDLLLADALGIGDLAEQAGAQLARHLLGAEPQAVGTRGQRVGALGLAQALVIHDVVDRRIALEARGQLECRRLHGLEVLAGQAHLHGHPGGAESRLLDDQPLNPRDLADRLPPLGGQRIQGQGAPLGGEQVDADGGHVGTRFPGTEVVVEAHLDRLDQRRAFGLPGRMALSSSPMAASTRCGHRLGALERRALGHQDARLQHVAVDIGHRLAADVATGHKTDRR